MLVVITCTIVKPPTIPSALGKPQFKRKIKGKAGLIYAISSSGAGCSKAV